LTRIGFLRTFRYIKQVTRMANRFDRIEEAVTGIAQDTQEMKQQLAGIRQDITAGFNGVDRRMEQMTLVMDQVLKALVKNNTLLEEVMNNRLERHERRLKKIEDFLHLKDE